MMMRPRYSLLPSSDESETTRLVSPRSPAFFDDEDEEEMLTRAPPIVYPPDPRFDRPVPPTWQRVGLILIILVSIGLAVYLQNGFWIGTNRLLGLVDPALIAAPALRLPAGREVYPTLISEEMDW
ncbi:hypothetical protein B0H11DRAFT_1908596 [Mycena galericulata]|nr:hypothetical protein B0H11DRAFT_1908596 [Mycena galericulata]